jgi:hypothetical protein
VKLRATTILVVFILLLGTAIAVPALRPFLGGLGWSLLLGTIGLWTFLTCCRRLPSRGPVLEGAAIGVAGTAGLLFLYQNVLVHDALWYYGYLRSAIVQRSLGLYEEFVLMNPHGMYLPPPETPLIHLGTALLQAPAALLARPLALALDRAGIVPGGDGFGPLEVGAATWTSMMLGIGGVMLVHRLARRTAGGTASAVAQVVLLYASPLAFFTFVWPAYPHATSVFLGAWFLLVWARQGMEGRRARPFLLGLLGGLLVLVRPQDIVYLALPVLDLVLDAGSIVRLRRGGSDWRSRGRSAGLLALGFVLGFAPQVAAWMGTAGKPLAHVYSEIGDPFIWARPAFAQVLFSGYNGLVSWTPICGLAILGLTFLRRSEPRLFRGLVLLLVLEWWAIASYGYWWGGASFGARYFLSAYPVLGVGLALLVARLARRTSTLAVGVGSVPFVYWNLLLMAQFRLEWIAHNRRPDFLAVLHRQLFDIPEVWISGLSGSFRWNQVLLIELLAVARSTGSWLRLAGWACLAALLVSLMLGWVMWLARERPSTTTVPARRVFTPTLAAALVASCMLLAAAISGWVAAAPGFAERRVWAELSQVPLRLSPRTDRSLSLNASAQRPMADRPTAVQLEATRPDVSERLSVDLISFLHNAEERLQGELIAKLWIRGEGCDKRPLHLRAGLETAETAPERFEIAGRMSHGIEKAEVIQSWWQQNHSERHYWGHAYLTSWELPPACRPDAVQIQTAEGPGDLEIRRLVIASTTDRLSAGPLAEL